MNPPQHTIALAYATECRRRRHQLKCEIKAGEVRLSELLREVELPKWLEGEPICRLVCAIDRVGTRKMNRLLADLGILERKAIGKMTYRQRCKLSVELAQLEGRALANSEKRARRHGRGGLRTSVTLTHQGGG